MEGKHKGILALLAVSVLTGSFGVFSHYISFNIPLFYQTSIRNGFQLTILVLLFLFLRNQKKSIARKDVKWFLLRSGCGFVNVVGLYIAFTKISIGTTYFLSLAVATICGYALGTLLFKESINRRGLIALGLSILGLALVYSVNFQTSTLAYSLAAVIAGIAAPGWSVFSKAISKTYSNLQMNLVDTAFALVFSVTLSLFLQEQWVAIEWSPIWIATFALASIFLVVGFLVVYGFRHVDAQVGTLLLLLEVVAGIVLGYLFYRQTISLWDATGGVMILLAIYLRTRAKTGRDLPGSVAPAPRRVVSGIQRAHE